eukprot:15438449-Alexandrium_andersonii.AAC.1
MAPKVFTSLSVAAAMSLPSRPPRVRGASSVSPVTRRCPPSSASSATREGRGGTAVAFTVKPVGTVAAP